jgi:transposase
VSSNGITWVGLDAHKKWINVVMLVPGREEPVSWQEANEENTVRRLARRLNREAPGEVRSCYEAGPLGYVLQRELEAQGVVCEVVAPSLIPIKPGDRIKTDWRDARKLAELLRAGLLTEVQPPNEADEALRDLCRGRDSVRQDLMRARHRMSKFLLRRGYRYHDTQRHWGVRHMAWLRPLRFEEAAAQAIFDHYLLTIDHLDERLRQVDAHLGVFGGQEPYRQPVAWLRCFRGIDTVTAVSLVAELHDFRRFRSARALMAYLGLVPSERSSGEQRRQGGITRAGNLHVRRLLVEAAWHHRHRPVLSQPLRKRREGQPATIITIADRAQERLYARFMRMTRRGIHYNKTVVAMARELVGYLWATLHPRDAEAVPDARAQ